MPYASAFMWLVSKICVSNPQESSSVPPRSSGHGLLTPKICSTATADLSVSHAAPKKGLLEALPFGLGVVSGERSKNLSACPIVPEWCHVVPNYTIPALYRTKESVFLRGAASRPRNISPVAPVFSHEHPAHDLESDESLCDLGLRVVRGAVEAKECENGYHILVDSCGRQLNAVWDLLSNAHPREECLADPKLTRCWGTRPGQRISVLGRDPLQRAS